MVSNDRSLKRKDDGALEDVPTKRVRTTNDDQLASGVSEGDSLSQGVPVPQLPKVEARSEDTNRAEEHGPAGKSSDDDEASGEADTAFVEEDTDSEDASDETSSSESDDNSEEEEGGEDDELSDLLSGGLPRPESHFYEKEPSDYEELLVERFHDEWEIASKTLLNRRLTDAFDDKSLWHGHYIRLISDQSTQRKQEIAESEHEWARAWLADSGVPEEKWGSRILFPDAPYVRVTPLRRLHPRYRGIFLGPSGLSKCIYPPPAAGTEVAETSASVQPRELADKPATSTSGLKASTTDTGVANKEHVSPRAVRGYLHAPSRHSQHGADWQDSERLIWEMMSAMPLPL